MSANAVLLSISLGSIAAAVLAVNNWRDRVHDKSIGRQTLAVVLGDKTFTAVFRIMTALPLALGLVMAAAPGFWPCLLVLLCLPLCLPLWKQFGTLQHEALNATMFGCVKYELAYSVLFSLGALLACLL